MRMFGNVCNDKMKVCLVNVCIVLLIFDLIKELKVIFKLYFKIIKCAVPYIEFTKLRLLNSHSIN